jgi:guanosine-3',5'-bis(diphosphate) 3'-pyrophosphohydrolase
MDNSKRETPWQRAIAVATRKHDKQLRKDGKTPYASHPMRVAFTIRHVFDNTDETALVAALLHDTIEDTTTDYDELVDEFGPDVAQVVAAVSKDGRLPHDQREAAYDRQLCAATWQARLVKLADVYDNFCDSRSDAERAKAADKARRAIQCAGDDPHLAAAVQIVRKLIERQSPE